MSATALDEALRLHREGRLREAFTHYAKILSQDPENAPALHYSGVVLHQSGEHVRAVELIRESIRIDQAPAEPWANLGQALAALGRDDAAVAALKEAARRAPSQPEIWSNLAVSELTAGQHAAAEASARRALALDAGYATGWYNLALILEVGNRVVEALDAASRAAALAPDVVAHAGLKAQLEQRIGQPGAARRTLESALARHPAAAPLRTQLAEIAEAEGRYGDAMRALEDVLRLTPGDGAALSQLLFLRKRCCDWRDLPVLRERFQRAIGAGLPMLSPFVLLSEPSTRGEQLRCSSVWSRQFEPQQPPRRPRRLLSPHRLRVGYLSADFIDHPTAVLTAGLFEAHDRGGFEILGYSTGVDDSSALRRRVGSAFDRFVDAHQWSSRKLADRIRADRVDILVDLKGHTAGAPTAAVALRPSPIQVQYLGYPGTMGASYIDYLIGDPVVTPLLHAATYSETLVLLTNSYQVNDRRRVTAEPLPRQALGLPVNGFVFCCFNNTFKLNPEVISAWAHVLSEARNAMLWLLARDEHDPAIVNLRQEFKLRGVDAERILFATHRRNDEYLALYHHADLFLDTWPYNAHTTASDALWCGCPVLTWCGETFAARVGASLLHAIGLPELITHDVDSYVRTAIDLAANRQRIEQYRGYLLGRGRDSALFDATATARALERAYLQMAEQHRTGRRAAIVIE